MRLGCDSFELVEYNCSIISKSVRGPHEFGMAWKAYLDSAGWDEDQYERELDRRVFKVTN